MTDEKWKCEINIIICHHYKHVIFINNKEYGSIGNLHLSTMINDFL